MSFATVIKLIFAFLMGALAVLAVHELANDPRLTCKVDCGRDTSPGPSEIGSPP
jgi:hypothetical protein